MATFVRTTAPFALLGFLRGARADLARQPHALMLLVTFGAVCAHAATYTPL